MEEGDRQPELWSVSAGMEVLEGRVGSRDLVKDYNDEISQANNHV